MGSLARGKDATQVTLDQRLVRHLACPRCRSPLHHGESWHCVNEACAYSGAGFPEIAGKPVLIDFADSIIDCAGLLQADGASVLARAPNRLRKIREWAEGGGGQAAANCVAFLERCRRFPEANVLVVGGGTRGDGTEALYAANDIVLVGTDVYESADVAVISDGHSLPFGDASFQGVWIQAVLEHVVAPEQVVAEIRRVLVDGGIVYAETPFLQPVHERAYDFTRFTRSGHRWLFRGFAELRAGTTGGPGASLIWSIRYLARALFRSEKIGSLFAVLFFWLRYLDGVVDARYRADAATGVFFLGTKTGDSIAPRDLVAYFPGVRGK